MTQNGDIILIFRLGWKWDRNVMMDFLGHVFNTFCPGGFVIRFSSNRLCKVYFKELLVVVFFGLAYVDYIMFEPFASRIIIFEYSFRSHLLQAFRSLGSLSSRWYNFRSKFLPILSTTLSLVFLSSYSRLILIVTYFLNIVFLSEFYIRTSIVSFFILVSNGTFQFFLGILFMWFVLFYYFY